MVYLYHGPQAVDKLPPEAIKFQAENLESVRIFNSNLLDPPITGQKNILSFGPLDAISDRAGDLLLKSLEDISNYNDVYLWCQNIECLKNTLISRCHVVWCPDAYTYTEQEKELGHKLANSLFLSEIVSISLTKDISLKNVATYALQKNPKLWGFLKPLFKKETILPTELVSALGAKWFN